MQLNRVLRDLDWAVHSPPLLNIESESCLWIDESWCKQQLIVAPPDQLRTFRDNLPQQRLGLYFESLLAFWIRHHPRYQLIAHNLPVRSTCQTITVGAFDFIVHDQLTNSVEHWEVAVKFYLGLGDLCRMSSWYGPGLKDRLDLKTQRLITHQSQLGHHTAGQTTLEQLGVEISERRIMMKGRLFYPWAQWPMISTNSSSIAPWLNPNHLSGWWMTLSEFTDSVYAHQFHWLPMGYDDWLSDTEHVPSTFKTTHQLLEDVEQTKFDYPRAVLGFKPGYTCEQTRGFIVPDDWPDRGRR